MEQHGRASDHDPVVVQIDFSKPTAPVSPEVKSEPGITPNKEDKKDNSTSQSLGVVATETGSVANGDTPKSKVKEVAPAKSVLPKTGLDTSSSLVFAGISAMMAFFLGRKKRN